MSISFSHPAINRVQESINVPIILPRDVPIDLHLEIFVGLKTRYLILKTSF